MEGSPQGHTGNKIIPAKDVKEEAIRSNLERGLNLKFIYAEAELFL